jgi:CRP-like cAMP-binding protein
MATKDTLSLQEKAALFENARGFEDLPTDALHEIAGLAFAKKFTKGETIFSPNEPCLYFYLVMSGLVKVSIYASSGFSLTYLLAEGGEPLNLVSPFTGALRSTSAEALKEVLLLCVKTDEFVSFAFKHPSLFINTISILGKAVDSANLRIIDMVEKSVEERLARVLYALYDKFGTPIKFTSAELASLTGTTTESILRALGNLRRKGIVRSNRGQTHIVEPSALTQQESGTLWF